MAEAGMNDRVLPPPLPPAHSLAEIVRRLPAIARERYEALRGSMADAESLQRSLMERLKEAEDKAARIAHRRAITNDAELAGELDRELEAARAALTRLEAERGRRNGVRANCEQVRTRIDNWLLQRASGAIEVTAPPKLSGLPKARHKGESVSDALLRTRREIAAAQAELLRIKSAPPPSDEIKLAIIEGVKRLAEEGRPRLVIEEGRVRLHLPDVMEYATPGSALSAPSGSASKMLAWLFRGPLTKRLLAEIADNEDGIDSAERPRLLREIEQRICGLEVAEEKLVVAALDAGLEVHRRIDASPFALLGLYEKAEAAEAAE
jgi:hypothetical protein